MHIFRLAPIFREGRAPLRPLAGGEGGTRRGSDGRVRWAAPLFGTRRSPTSPQPSPPHRRRGGYFGHLPCCEICACPSAFAWVTTRSCDEPRRTHNPPSAEAGDRRVPLLRGRSARRTAIRGLARAGGGRCTLLDDD